MAGSRGFVSVRLRRRCRVQSDDASVFVSEGEEIAEAWARWSVANPYASPGIGRSSDASAVNMMKTPVFRSALVELACGMQVLWPISERGATLWL